MITTTAPLRLSLIHIYKTINEPDTYTEEVCNQFIKREDKTCQENLTVTVTKTESCVPGTYIASGVYAARDDTNRIEARCDFDHSNMNFRILSCDVNNGCYGSWRTFTINMSAPSSGNSPQNAYERVGGWTMRPTTYTSQAVSYTHLPANYFYAYAPHKDSLDSRYAMMGLVSYDRIQGRAIPLF